MPYAKLTDARLHYDFVGPDDAPVLVLSHALGANFSMWDPQMPAFTKHFRVLRYDTRGHGQSSFTPGPYSIALPAQDVLALLDTLHLERAQFCGLSMGGSIALWLAANASHRFQKFVLCSAAGKIGSAETWNARIATVSQSGLNSVASANMERWFTPAFRELQPSVVDDTRRVIASTDPGGYIACCAAIRDADFRETLAQVRTPTLVISGAQDPVAPPADGHFLAAHISGARYAEINAAHLSNVEDPARFNSEVGAFLKH